MKDTIKKIFIITLSLILVTNTVYAEEDYLNDLNRKLQEEREYLDELFKIQYEQDNPKNIILEIDGFNIDIQNRTEQLFETNIKLINNNSYPVIINLYINFDYNYFCPNNIIKPYNIDYFSLTSRETQEIASLGIEIDNTEYFITNDKPYIELYLEGYETIYGQALLGIGNSFKDLETFSILYKAEIEDIIINENIGEDIIRTDGRIEHLKNEIEEQENIIYEFELIKLIEDQEILNDDEFIEEAPEIEEEYISILNNEDNPITENEIIDEDISISEDNIIIEDENTQNETDPNIDNEEYTENIIISNNEES